MIPVLVKNEFCVVVTPVTALANVGFTSVTTVAPGCPLTSFMTLAKVDVTPVTQVAAGRGQQCGVKADDGECCEKCLVRDRRQ